MRHAALVQPSGFRPGDPAVHAPDRLPTASTSGQSRRPAGEVQSCSGSCSPWPRSLLALVSRWGVWADKSVTRAVSGSTSFAA